VIEEQQAAAAQAAALAAPEVVEAEAEAPEGDAAE
jgi:hypothetical protein